MKCLERFAGKAMAQVALQNGVFGPLQIRSVLGRSAINLIAFLVYKVKKTTLDEKFAILVILDV